MKSFHLPENISVVLISFLVFLITGCSGQTNREVWNADIIKRVPIINIKNSPSAFTESQQEDWLLSNEGTIDLSIEQAVIATLQYNRDLKIQRLDPVKAGTFAIR